MLLLDRFPQFLPEDILLPMMSIGMIYVAMPFIEQVIKYATVYDTPTKLFFAATFCSTLVPALVTTPRYQDKHTVKKYKLYSETKGETEDLTSLSPRIDEVENCKIKGKKLVLKSKV